MEIVRSKEEVERSVRITNRQVVQSIVVSLTRMEFATAIDWLLGDVDEHPME